VVLIELREDGGDLALSKRVVQGIVNVRRKNAEARRGVAVNHQRGQKPVVLLVAGYIAELGERREFSMTRGVQYASSLGSTSSKLY